MPIDTCSRLCTPRCSIFRSALLSCAQHLSVSVSRPCSLSLAFSRDHSFNHICIRPICRSFRYYSCWKSEHVHSFPSHIDVFNVDEAWQKMETIPFRSKHYRLVLRTTVNIWTVWVTVYLDLSELERRTFGTFRQFTFYDVWLLFEQWKSDDSKEHMKNLTISRPSSVLGLMRSDQLRVHAYERTNNYFRRCSLQISFFSPSLREKRIKWFCGKGQQRMKMIL